MAKRTTKGKAIRAWHRKNKRQKYNEKNGTPEERAARIEVLLRDSGESLKAAEIGERLGISSAAAGAGLSVLQQRERVWKAGRRWRWRDPRDPGQAQSHP